MTCLVLQGMADLVQILFDVGVNKNVHNGFRMNLLIESFGWGLKKSLEILHLKPMQIKMLINKIGWLL